MAPKAWDAGVLSEDTEEASTEPYAKVRPAPSSCVKNGLKMLSHEV
uniref:Uncharacterized protein n=1 Tax=Candidatus Kentrum sp. DK TaxID=2126562 RepID=A0A450SD67_9GAMM|nr:MAG: hypothetical protein BECKDK2373B_GA0170837_10288 [Candidatus Kentron sp. DK]